MLCWNRSKGSAAGSADAKGLAHISCYYTFPLYGYNGELAIRRYLYHLYRLLLATVFAKICIFFNDLCTVRTFFGISFRYQRRKQYNNNNKQREKGA